MLIKEQLTTKDLKLFDPTFILFVLASIGAVWMLLCEGYAVVVIYLIYKVGHLVNCTRLRQRQMSM